MADELGSSEQSLASLRTLREQTQACYSGERRTRLFAALGPTIDRHAIPIDPFLDLIDAFEQDQRIDRYGTFEQLIDYCRRSADPVGRLVLYMCGYQDPERQRLSDLTCTALQLTNFWQDVQRDYVERDRIYLPRDWMDEFGVSEEQIQNRVFDERFRRMMLQAVDKTQAMFDEGEKLIPMLHPQVRRHVGLFGKGGAAILKAIRKQQFDTLSHRPTLSRWQKARLAVFALGAGLAGTWHPGAAA